MAVWKDSKSKNMMQNERIFLNLPIKVCTKI